MLLAACERDDRAPRIVRPTEQPEVVLLAGDPARSEVAGAGILTTAFALDRDGDGIDDQGWVLAIRGDGSVDWAAEPPPGFRYVRVRHARDGTLLLMEGVPEGARPVGRIVRWRPDGGELGSIHAPTAHHELVELDDGRIAWLAHRFTTAEVVSLGDVPVTGDQLVVAGQDGGARVRIDTLDDYPVQPWYACAHNDLGRRFEGRHDLLHTNSAVRDPAGGGWLLMPRYLDAVLRFDDAGGFDWQLGGRDSDFALEPDARFAHAHFSHAWDDRLLIFDNGPEHDEDGYGVSRVVELVVDREARRVSVAWEYRHPRGAHTRFLGDAQRLPGGNTLVSWGSLGRITEVTPDGEQVWGISLRMPVGRVELAP